jgi:hypothetical protein
VNASDLTFVGISNGVDSNLLVTKSATLNNFILSVGGISTKGTVAVDGGSPTAWSIDLGEKSPMGTLAVSSGNVAVNGPDRITVGSSGGNGQIPLNPASNLTLTNGTLAVGTDGGSLTAQANLIFAPLPQVLSATANAGGQDVVVGGGMGNGSWGNTLRSTRPAYR